MECHSTFADKISPEGEEPEAFASNRIIYGVDCEKCHGPAKQHVDFHTSNPKETIAKYILNPHNLNREQSLDMCRLCHGGRLNKTKPSFSFQPGDKLTDFFALDTAKKDAANIDVHGNQYGLLAASECFKKSDLTCVTCHDSHKNESSNLALFSQRCLSCHNADKGIICPKTKTIGNKINSNCIDCHMPNQPSKSIAVLLEGNKVPVSAVMRTHYIKPYPEETKKLVAFFAHQQLKNK